MNWFLKFGWIILFIISVLIQVFVDMSIKSIQDINKLDLILGAICWILSLIGFILFIYWTIKFNGIMLLKTLSIIMPIIFIACFILMLSTSDDKTARIFLYIIPYTVIISIGVIISYLAKYDIKKIKKK